MLIVGCEPDLDSLLPRDSSGSGGSAGGGGGSGSGGSGMLPEQCMDEVKQLNEADVDCGGTYCIPCEVGKMCAIDDDCRTLFCHPQTFLCEVPSCFDGWTNQDETDVDCGGICAGFKKCELGDACEVGSDCTSDFCLDGECTNHCESGATEADETDDDCGGSTCAPCADGKACLVESDCESETCPNERCVAQSCTDDTKNNSETDEDCGGPVCDPCPDDLDCVLPRDCLSYVCAVTTNVCAPDLDIPTDDRIDYMEDGDVQIELVAGRQGNWYPFGDAEGEDDLVFSSIPGRRGMSLRAAQSTGSGFTTWGSGFGLDLNNPGGQAATKQGYNVTGYVGITFWARAEVLISVTVAFPDRNTDPAGGICGDAGTCDYHWEKPSVQLGSDWKRFTVLFDELQYTGSGTGFDALDREGLISIQFRYATSATYDVWVDDLAFLKP